MLFGNGFAMFERRAGEGEDLVCLDVWVGPDKGVVSGAPVAKDDSKRIGGHAGGYFLGGSFSAIGGSKSTTEEGQGDGDEADTNNDEPYSVDAAVRGAGKRVEIPRANTLTKLTEKDRVAPA